MSAATALQAVSLLVDLLNASARLGQQIAIVSPIVARAQTEGRDTLTDDEWAQIRAADDAARAALVSAIGGGQ